MASAGEKISSFKLGIPHVTEASECARLCKLVREAKSVSHESAFATSETSELEPHYVEENSKGLRTMIVTSEEYGYIGIAFSGPDSAEYWQKMKKDRSTCDIGPRDVTLPFKLEEGACVHSYVNDMFFCDDAHAAIEETLNELIKKFPNYSVLLTGHGMGGAVATIVGMFIGKQKPILQVKVLNFGAPRICEEKLKGFIDSIPNLIVWRFVFGCDIVTSIPSMTMGFRHVGHLIHLNSKAKPKAYYNYEDGDQQGYIRPVNFCKCAF